MKVTYSETRAANKSFLSRFARFSLNEEDTYTSRETLHRLISKKEDLITEKTDLRICGSLTLAPLGPGNPITPGCPRAPRGPGGPGRPSSPGAPYVC